MTSKRNFLSLTFSLLIGPILHNVQHEYGILGSEVASIV